jgi:hypothetical protein
VENETSATADRAADGAADRKADLKAAAIVFVMLVLGAIYFVSGWTFDLG